MNQILSNHDKDKNNRNNNNYNPNMGHKYNNGNNYGHVSHNTNRNHYNNRVVTNKHYYDNYGKGNIKTVIRVFAIISILFGIVIITQSALALNSKEWRPKDHPQVTMDKMGKEVTIGVLTENPIKEIRYKWNDGEETTIEGNGTVKFEHVVDLPNGNNILNVYVIDYYGNKTYYQNQFIYESMDQIKPSIDLAKTGSKLKITAKDETKMLYLIYQWNDEAQIRTDAHEGENEISVEIEVKQGQNTLTIIAVDGEENKAQRIEKIIGDVKPTLILTAEGNNVVINAKDDEGIEKIEVTIDDKKQEQEVNQKEITAKVPITQGRHRLKIVVTNVNGLQAIKEVTANI